MLTVDQLKRVPGLEYAPMVNYFDRECRTIAGAAHNLGLVIPKIVVFLNDNSQPVPTAFQALEYNLSCTIDKCIEMLGEGREAHVASYRQQG
jgi:hypothetical protein